MAAIDRKPAQPYAIVVGLDCITGLQAARILAQRGVPVIGIARDKAHYCSRTRVCDRIIAADTGSEAVIQALETLGKELNDKAVLYPCTDMSVLLISRNRHRLFEHYHISLPEAEVVEMLMDKISFCHYAQKEGLPIPGTFFLSNSADAERAAKQLTFPCIVKPPIKTPTWERNAKAKVFKAFDRHDFLRLYERCSGWADLLMVQEWVEGSDADLYSCNCYFNVDSEPIVTFIARKLRQWPPETGTSCLGEECRNEEVLTTTIELFRKVSYQGLGYLEMKRDARSGKHFVIEPNIGRPTGRSAIAEAGGVDLLYAMYCDRIGWPLPANLEQKYGGVKWIYLRRDIQSAWHYWRTGKLTLRGWWQSWRGKKAEAVFSWTDPVPFLSDIGRAVSLLLTNRGRKWEATFAGAQPNPPPAAIRKGPVDS